MADQEQKTKHIFVSYCFDNEAVTKEIVACLEGSGYSTVVAYRDFTGDFVECMDRALQETSLTLAILSKEYMRSEQCGREWRPSFNAGRLALVRVDEVEPVGLLATKIYHDYYAHRPEERCTQLCSYISRDNPSLKLETPASPEPRKPGRRWNRVLLWSAVAVALLFSAGFLAYRFMVDSETQEASMSDSFEPDSSRPEWQVDPAKWQTSGQVRIERKEEPVLEIQPGGNSLLRFAARKLSADFYLIYQPGMRASRWTLSDRLRWRFFTFEFKYPTPSSDWELSAGGGLKRRILIPARLKPLGPNDELRVTLSSDGFTVTHTFSVLDKRTPIHNNADEFKVQHSGLTFGGVPHGIAFESTQMDNLLYLRTITAEKAGSGQRE